MPGIKSLLFSNITPRQTIFKNTFWLAIAEGSSRLMTFVLFIYVARILGATEYGKFSYALAAIGLFNIFLDFVSPQIITREFAQDKDKEKEYSSITSLKIIFGIGSLILIFVGSFFVTQDLILRKVIWILSAYYFLLGFLEIFYAFLRARQLMEYESFAKILDGFLTAAFGLFAIIYFPSIENLSYAYLFEGLALLAFVLLFFHYKIYKISFGWNKAVFKRIFLLSWPIALVGITASVYNQIDSFMMGYWGLMAENGWYNAAFKITRMVFIPMALVSQSFYPAQSKIFKASKEEFQKIWNSHMEIMVLLAMPILIGGLVLAPKIINFFYGQAYNPAILAFQILIVTVAIIFIYEAFRQVLIVANQQKKLFWVVLAGAIINIALNLVLIPKFSLYGAAIATVFTHILISLLLVGFTIKYTAVKPFNLKILFAFFNAFISGAIMYFAISQPIFFQFNLVLLVALGAAVYFLALLILKLILKSILWKI